MISNEEPSPELSRVVDIHHLEEGENVIKIDASDEERAKLARRFGIQKIDRLIASVQLEVDKKKTKIHLTGELDADVTQECVVTLQPVENQIESAFERNFSDSPDLEGEPEEIDLGTVGEDEPPEPILDGKIDIGEIIAEQLALEIDPFPRVPGT